MTSLKQIFQQWHHQTSEPLPNEAQCSVCGYFDINHPDVKRILKGMDLLRARCRCSERALATERRRQMMWQQANLPHPNNPRTLDNFEVLPGTEPMLQACKGFVADSVYPVLILAGGTGPGKSHLLEAVVRDALLCGRSARFELSSSMLDRWRSCYRNDSEEDLGILTRWYQDLWLMAVDDIGLERGTEWEREKLTAFIEERIAYERRLILSTNLTHDEMAMRLGDRLASRLFPLNPELHDVQLITIVADDFRGRR